MSDTNIYKEASKNNLTFAVPRLGVGSFTDLWALDLKVLDQMYAELHKELDNSSTLSLLNPKRVDSKKKLQLDILVDVVKTRQQDTAEAKARQAENTQRQARKQLLLEAIASKEAGQVMEMSLEDLQKQLDELG